MDHIPTLNLQERTEVVPTGQLLRQRGLLYDSVLYVESGCVALGVWAEGQLRHHLGVVQGPAWLDAAYALTHSCCAMDMVAATRVQLRRVPHDVFVHQWQALPRSAAALVQDMAAAYCQQTEIAISRLAQDAHARCAQWLLRHAQADACGVLHVKLGQRKRTIAAHLGIAPETFSRVLRHLRDHGLVTGTGGMLQLPQPVALQNLAGL